MGRQKAGYRAELATIGQPRPDSMGMMRMCPSITDTLERALDHFWNEMNCVEIYFVPRNRRIFFETGFALLAEVIRR